MNKSAIIYWSGSGNTESMARSILLGMQQIDGETQLFHVSQIKPEDIKTFTHIAFGCPSMGAEVLEETEFDPFFTKVESDLSGRKIALFGSYGWGDGEWMRDWESRVSDSGAILFESGLIVNEKPTPEDETDCLVFGNKFASF